MESSNQNSSHNSPPPYSQNPSAPTAPSANQPPQNPDYIPFNANVESTYEPINEQGGKNPIPTGYSSEVAPPPYPVQAGYNPHQIGYTGQMGGVAYAATTNQEGTTVYVQQVIVPLSDPPPTYLVHSILNLIFCCWIFGIVAVTKSVASDSAAKMGFRENAVRESREARKWNIVGLIFGSIVWAGLIITIILLCVLDD